ncbi:MAG: MFS transporter [Deltaproteobacteria bacterium]|nr:MFS transporter [Deltaproteobacteria bacterium]
MGERDFSFIREINSKMFYGYIIVGAAFLIQLSTWGVHCTFGIFFVAVAKEFAWSRVVISSAFSLYLFLMGIMSIISGRINDRFGPRLVMSLSCSIIGLGYFLMSMVNEIWHFYFFYGVIVAIGMGGVDIATLSTIARWFVKKRGMMTGIVKAGAGAGMFILPPVINWLIYTYGWRTTYIIISVMIFIGSVSASQFLKFAPREMGLNPYGEEVNEKSSNSEDDGFLFQKAILTIQFWQLCVVFFLFLVCTQIILVHLYAHIVDTGISGSVAATILATVGGASIAGRLIMGSAGDRIGNKPAMIIDLAIMSVASFLLFFADAPWMFFIYACLHGFSHGGLFTLISPMVADLFGLVSHGIIFGVVSFSGNIGGTIGPIVAGRIFDLTGSYQTLFIIFSSAAILGTFIMVLIKDTELSTA